MRQGAGRGHHACRLLLSGDNGGGDHDEVGDHFNDDEKEEDTMPVDFFCQVMMMVIRDMLIVLLICRG